MTTPTPELVTTRARLLSLNTRRSSSPVDALIPTRRWVNRKPRLIAFIKNVAPSVIGLQEATKTQSHDITAGLGANWTYFGGDGAGNVPIMWDSSKWDPIDSFESPLPAGGERYIVMVELRSRTTGGTFGAVNVHLTVGDSRQQQAWRHDQIEIACLWARQRFQHGRIVIFGDFNSDCYPGDDRIGGVRREAAKHGFRHLRYKLDDEITRNNYSTFNGWKTTPRDGRWIDDILTTTTVKPYAGAVFIAGPPNIVPTCTDHNGVFAKVEFRSPVAPLPLA